MSEKNKKKKDLRQKKYEDRPLSNKPFASYFKRTHAGRAWVNENLPKEKPEP